MTDQNEPIARNGGAGSDEAIIRPVGYQPRDEVSESGFRLSRAQIITIAIVIPTLLVVWFLFTAKSVRLTFEPEVESVSVSGGPTLTLGGIYLLREGEYRVAASAPGYFDLDASLAVGEDRNQLHHFQLSKLPGLVSFETEPSGAQVAIDGIISATTPTAALEVPAGSRQVTFSAPRYQPLALVVDIAGKHEPQTVSGTLTPNWADVTLATEPAGASIFLDDEPTGLVTPATIEALAGEHEIRIKLAGHREHRQRILVAAEEKITLPTFTLQQADGLINVTTRPVGAGVTLNGTFQGESPLELAVRSGASYRIQVFKAGYQSAQRTINLGAGEERDLAINLSRQMGDVQVTVEPPEAEIFINGQLRGSASTTITLPTVAHDLSVQLDGYAGYETSITPKTGLVQEVKVRLLTLEEARLAALKPRVQTKVGQQLVLVKPEPFTMGASRRQPGRRANETLREVQMQRFFYIGTQEVTNAQFMAWASGHVSGEFEDQDLGKADQPVVNVSWQEGLPITATGCRIRKTCHASISPLAVRSRASTPRRPATACRRKPSGRSASARWRWKSHCGFPGAATCHHRIGTETTRTARQPTWWAGSFSATTTTT